MDLKINWKESTLGELLELIIDYRGKTPKKLGSDWQNSGLPAISAKNIKNGRFVRDDTVKFVSEELYSKWMKHELDVGDILLTSEAPLGETLFLKKKLKLVLSQRLFALRVKKSISEPRYLSYYLESDIGQSELHSRATGATAQGIRQSLLIDVKVYYPPLPVQIKIAAILSSYDDLIENNLRRIKILEEMAQSLYREWFVNFRFPGHENTCFVDPPLGRIPEGWEVYRLGDIATIDKGLSYKGLFLTEEGDPMVNLKCIIPGGGYNRSGTKPYSGKYNAKQKVNSGDVVFANTDITQAGNVIGTPAIIPSEGFSKGGLASHHISIVRLGESCPFKQVFLYHLLLNSGFKDYAKSCASGTTVLGFRSSDALDYKFIMPPILLVENYELFVENIYYMYEILMDKNATLRQTRDLLLPKLISGEVDVSDLDIKITEEVSG